MQDCVDESVNKLSKFLGVRLEKKLTMKRFNYNKLPSRVVSRELQEKIKVLNKVDIDIYEKIVKDYNYKVNNDIVLNYYPWQFPLNLVAGVDSIKKYETLLKSTKDRLNVEKKDHKLDEYINNFLNIFCDEINVKLVSEYCWDKLFELGVKLNDKSDKIVIITRF